MTDFILRKDQSAQIPEFLRSTVVGFEESPEYQQLRGYEQDISGVVLGAFAGYLCKIHEKILVGHAEQNTEAVINSAHEAIEVLASSPGSTSRDLVTDELYENLECKEDVLKEIRRHLKPNALALYERYTARR